MRTTALLLVLFVGSSARAEEPKNGKPSETELLRLMARMDSEDFFERNRAFQALRPFADDYDTLLFLRAHRYRYSAEVVQRVELLSADWHSRRYAEVFDHLNKHQSTRLRSIWQLASPPRANQSTIDTYIDPLSYVRAGIMYWYHFRAARLLDAPPNDSVLNYEVNSCAVQLLIDDLLNLELPADLILRILVDMEGRSDQWPEARGARQLAEFIYRNIK